MAGEVFVSWAAQLARCIQRLRCFVRCCLEKIEKSPSAVVVTGTYCAIVEISTFFSWSTSIRNDSSDLPSWLLQVIAIANAQHVYLCSSCGYEREPRVEVGRWVRLHAVSQPPLMRCRSPRAAATESPTGDRLPLHEHSRVRLLRPSAEYRMLCNVLSSIIVRRFGHCGESFPAVDVASSTT